MLTKLTVIIVRPMPELSGRPLLDTKTDSALFVDREAELQALLDTVKAGLNALLLGERGLGKTTLLRQLAYRLRAEGVASVFADGALAEDAASLLDLTVLRIVAEQGGRAPAGGLMDAHGTREPERLLRTVDALRAALPQERRTVVLVNGVPSAPAAHTLFGRLRDELWQLPLSWVVAVGEVERSELLAPPADAFFERVVTLRALDPETSADLVRARLEGEEIAAHELDHIVAAGEGNPRRLLAMTRLARAGTELRSLVDGRIELRTRLERLGRPAAMLVEELEARGPSSASDEDLLRSLGWTRGRAVQVFKQLEGVGLVRASQRSGPNGGRPRTMYELTSFDERGRPGAASRDRTAS